MPVNLSTCDNRLKEERKREIMQQSGDFRSQAARINDAKSLTWASQGLVLRTAPLTSRSQLRLTSVLLEGEETYHVCLLYTSDAADE